MQIYNWLIKQHVSALFGHRQAYKETVLNKVHSLAIPVVDLQLLFVRCVKTEMYCSWQNYLPCATLDIELIKPFNLFYIYIFILFIIYLKKNGRVVYFRILQDFYLRISRNMAGWCLGYSLYSRGDQRGKILEQYYKRQFRQQHRVYPLLK